MSRKVCRRKHYALVNVVDLAISGATISSAADLDKLRMRELLAIDAFKNRKATPADFRDLCDLLNLCQTMAEMGIGPEALESCRKTQAALIRAKDQLEETGSMGFSATDYVMAKELYEYHDAQRLAVDRSTYERAIARTRNRIRSAHPDVKELV